MKIEKFYKKDKQPKAPSIIVRSSKVMQKIISIIKAKDVEVMLLGEIEIQGKDKNLYCITKVRIPPMDNNSSAFVTTDDEKFGPWLHNIPREQRLKLRLHLHTHPKMGVTPSGTDESMIKDKVENISDFYIRMIANHDLEFRVDFFDLKNNLKYTELNLYQIIDTPYGQHAIVFNTDGQQYLVNSKDTKKFKFLEEELDRKIKKAKTYSGKYLGGSHRPYFGNNHYDDYDEYRHRDNVNNTIVNNYAEKRFIEAYNIAESEMDLLTKLSDLETEINYTEMSKEDILHDFLLLYYDVAAGIRGCKKEFIRAFKFELEYLLREEPHMRTYTVDDYVKGYMPYLSDAIAWYKGSKTGILKKEYKMTLEEWLKNAKYLKTS